MTLDPSRPIGLFDSGIGGLTVARQVMELMPRENTVYFGDTARVPYGSKSPRTVVSYARQAARFLESLGVKLIIVACNTASAHALSELSEHASVPVIGVIEPGADAAVSATLCGSIGIIGTEGTVRSDAYGMAVRSRNGALRVYGRACPLLVGFAEEGLIDHPATQMMCEEYLSPLVSLDIDTLIMGCTHYPILAPAIARVVGNDVTLVDPGVSTAVQALRILEAMNAINTSHDVARHDYYLSDLPLKFVEVGERFLGRRFENVHRVALEDLAVVS